MRERLLKEESGFTLTELMVTMMLMLMVSFALYSIFDMSIRVFSFGNDKTEAVQNARLGLERMERELRAAYPYTKLDGNPSNDSLFPSYAPNSITFSNDLDLDRQVDTDTATEQITYGLSGNTLQRNSQSVVEFVKTDGLSFNYLDKNGNPTTIEKCIRRVQIKLEVVVKRGPQAGTQVLVTDVTLRNRVGHDSAAC